LSDVVGAIDSLTHIVKDKIDGLVKSFGSSIVTDVPFFSLPDAIGSTPHVERGALIIEITFNKLM
jgi:hypothetical protein